MARWQWPVTPAGKAQLWSQKFDGDALTPASTLPTPQEDAHAIILDVDAATGREKVGEATSLFAVFDGHGGKEVARYAARHLAEHVVAAPGYGDGNLETAMAAAYLSADASVCGPDARPELADLAAPSPAAEGGSGDGSGGRDSRG